MGDIAEMDVAIWEGGGRPDGTYGLRRKKHAQRGRWKRGFDYTHKNPYGYLVDKFLISMAGQTFGQALETITRYCAERGFMIKSRKPYGQMARLIQLEFAAFRKWFHENYPH